MAEESGDGASDAGVWLLDAGGANDICIPCVPTVQSRYDVASSKSVRSDILPGFCVFVFVFLFYFRKGEGATHPHSRAGSSRSSIFGKRWSRNALSSAYSLSAVRSGCESKVPIQPRRRVLQVPLPLALYLRVFHVTKSGL